eukprot:19683-Heterococcus_DN1.PRE.4
MIKRLCSSVAVEIARCETRLLSVMLAMLACSVSRGTISKFKDLGAAVAVRTAQSVVEQTTAAAHTCTMNIAVSLQAVLIVLVIAACSLQYLRHLQACDTVCNTI